MSWDTSHKQGWRVASIYDPATGDVVQFDEIDHAISGIGFEEILNELSNTKSQSGREVILRLGSTDFTGISQIETWVDEGTPVNAVVAGDKNVQFYENVPLTQFKKQPAANRRDGDQRWSVALEYAGGYNMEIYNNVNLLHQTNVAGEKVTGFVDEGETGVPDGYNSTIFTNNSFNDVTKEVTSAVANSSTFARMFRDIRFPIVGIDLNLSINITSWDISFTSGGPKVAAQTKNYSGTGLTVYTSVTSVAGRININFVSDSETYRLECRIIQIDAVASDGAGDVIYKNPTLRTDGKSEYIAG